MLRNGVLAFLGGVLLVGCAGSTPRAADPGQAVEALKVTLEAWKNGQKSGSLRQHATAITASDPDWEKGTRLLRYEVLDSESRPSGFDLSCPVRLWLDDNKPRRVSYSVSTSPRLVVVRDLGSP